MVRVLVVLSIVAGCSDVPDYAFGSAEGSLAPFFADADTCVCNLDLAPSERRVQFGCSPKSGVGYDLVFYAGLAPSANQRGRSYAQVQLDHLVDTWPSTGFGACAAEVEYGDEEFGRPGLDPDQQVTKYREVFVWALDVQAQEICSVLDAEACQQLDAGRATELRFTCTVVPH